MSRNHLAKDDDTVAVPKAARDARAVLEGVTPAAAAATTCTGPSRSTWAGAGPQLLASRHLAYRHCCRAGTRHATMQQRTRPVGE